jgi:hypothetical protein
MVKIGARKSFSVVKSLFKEMISLGFLTDLNTFDEKAPQKYV